MMQVSVYVRTGKTTNWFVGHHSFDGIPQVGQVVFADTKAKTLRVDENGFYRVIQVDVRCPPGVSYAELLVYLDSAREE